MKPVCRHPAHQGHNLWHVWLPHPAGFARPWSPQTGAATDYWCYDANGQFIRDTVVCIAVSAARFKENIQPLTTGLETLLKLNPISYKLKPDYNTLFKYNPNYNGTQYGLVADEVQKIDPHLVTIETSTTTFEDKIYPPGVVHGLADLNNWVGLFTKSIQDLFYKVVGIDNRVSALEKENQELKARLSAIEQKLK